MARYTCPHCETESHELSSDAEANQLLAVHLQLRHGNLNRAEPTPGRTARRALSALPALPVTAAGRPHGRPWGRHRAGRRRPSRSGPKQHVVPVRRGAPEMVGAPRPPRP